MPCRIELSPERIAEGRHLYEHTDMPVHAIAARLGMSRWTLKNRLIEWGWQRRYYSKGEGLAPIRSREPAPIEPPPAIADSAATIAPPPADEPPLAFAERIKRVRDAEMAVIERTLKVLGPASNAEAERTTRILAMISRTVQEIQASAEGQTSSDETDDDTVPGDIDEFREELARRIRAFVDAKRAGPGGVHGDGAV
jgi:hypothetical protein